MNESDRPAILNRIVAIIREQLHVSVALDSTTRAPDVPGWDSFAQVNIILAVERAFAFRFRAADMAQLDNIGALVDVVVARGKLA
jgi:acyl carrier protein